MEQSLVEHKNYITELREENIVITVSRHDLDDPKHKNGVATDLFCTGVIGHSGYIFLN